MLSNFPVFIVTLVAVIFLVSIDRGCLALLTTGCINWNTPSTACCSGDIEISSSIMSIGYEAFLDCSITSVIIPNNVQYINDYAFYNNQISSLTIGSGVEMIFNSAFCHNKLPNVSIPSTVTSVGDMAFFNNRLVSYVVESPNTSIGAYAFAGQFGHLVIPDGVSSIDEDYFSSMGLRSVAFPNSVTSIGFGAFSANNLTFVSIPSTVISVGDKAFLNNRLASYVVESPSTTSIGDYAFAAQFGHLVIPDGVTSIDDSNYFARQNLISVAFPSSLQSIGDGAFSENLITSVVFPDGLQTIGDEAFYENLITSVVFPDGLQTIGAHAFLSNQITSLTIPPNVHVLEDSVFGSNNLTFVSIPSTVTRIGDKAFLNNRLASYVIESPSTTTIGAYAFAAQFGHLVIPDGVTRVEGFGSKKLLSVTLPESVTYIGFMALCCNLFTSITIPSRVQIIEEETFRDNKLTSITIPDNVTSIGAYAFQNNQISSLTIGKSVQTIGNGAFENNLLSSATIPASVQTIGSDRTFDYNNENFCLVYQGEPFDYPSCPGNSEYPTAAPTTATATSIITQVPTRRPTMRDGRPAKGIKFRGDRGDKNPPAFAAFINSEETTDRSPDANIEYHCFEHDARYVRGTYGMRGYFEGKLDGHIAYVNFFEIANDGETLVPTTGSAAITYSDDWSSVDGPFWSTGSSTMPGSWGSWGALESCVNCFPSDMSMKRIRKEKCLWSDNEHSHYKKLPDLSDRIMGSEQTANTWFNIGYGPRDTSGVMVGSYHYTYTEQQCSDWSYDCSGLGFDEVGRYGSHSVSANVKGGRILASDLQISSGPLGGHIGSGLYLIFNYEDGSVGYTGYFCAADWIVDDSSAQTSTTSGSSSSSSGMGSGNMKLVLVDCAYDAGDEMAADSDQAVHLLGAGYGNVWNIYSDEWQRLSRFFQLSTISTTTN